MFASIRRANWGRTVLLGLATGAALVAGANPAAADYRRSCQFFVEVEPDGTGLDAVNFPFRVHNTVDRYVDVNDARRAIRSYVTDCVVGHWFDRNETRPYACRGEGRIEMTEYPFENMREQVEHDICAANARTYRLNVSLRLFIRGERGCLERSEEIGLDPVARVEIESGVEINCPVPDSSSWDTHYTPPATPPLPNTRLPGNDISVEPAPDWQTCWTRCRENGTCRAWTFRGAGASGAGSAAMCLLKSRAGTVVPDACCQSGIKE